MITSQESCFKISAHKNHKMKQANKNNRCFINQRRKRGMPLQIFRIFVTYCILISVQTYFKFINDWKK